MSYVWGVEGGVASAGKGRDSLQGHRVRQDALSWSLSAQPGSRQLRKVLPRKKAPSLQPKTEFGNLGLQRVSNIYNFVIYTLKNSVKIEEATSLIFLPVRTKAELLWPEVNLRTPSSVQSHSPLRITKNCKLPLARMKLALVHWLSSELLRMETERTPKVYHCAC